MYFVIYFNFIYILCVTRHHYYCFIMSISIQIYHLFTLSVAFYSSLHFFPSLQYHFPSVCRTYFSFCFIVGLLSKYCLFKYVFKNVFILCMLFSNFIFEDFFTGYGILGQTVYLFFFITLKTFYFLPLFLGSKQLLDLFFSWEVNEKFSFWLFLRFSLPLVFNNLTNTCLGVTFFLPCLDFIGFLYVC